MSRQIRQFRQLWLLFAAVTLIAMVGAGCYRLALNQESAHAKRITDQAATNLQNHLESRIRENARALMRMADRIRVGSEANQTYWQADAKNYVHDVNEYRAVEWIDKDLRIQWIEPIKGNEKKLGLSINFNEKRKVAIHRARDLREIAMSQTVDLVQGGQGFLIYAPVFRGDKFEGMIGGVCVASLIANSIPPQLKRDYEIELGDGGLVTYCTNPSAFKKPPIVATVLANNFGTEWKIRVLPKPATLARWASPLPMWILGFTAVAELLISFAILLWIEVRKHAKLEKDRRRAIQTNNEVLEQVLRTAPVGMAMIRPDGTLVRVNQALCQFFGYEEAELRTLGTREVTYPDDIEPTLSGLSKLLSGEIQKFEAEKRYIKKNGEVAWAHLNASAICDTTGKPFCILAQIIDQTHHRQQVAELASLAQLDGLTGLANRRTLDAKLDEAVLAARQEGRALCIIMLDVDHFKSFNDEFGHQTGDFVLQNVARIVQDVVRTSDLVARYGGEEFFILCAQTRLTDTLRLAERIRAAIEQYPWAHRQVTASFGVAEWSLEIQTPSDLLALADLGLYRAKAQGRNQVCRVSERNVQGEPIDKVA
jgi:diguanylate cyclase (GGDEF)-like protein/PAS domain S-box-containing protein